MAGLFVSFEGGEGVGKTTQIALLADRLQREGYRVLPVHEPGSTQLGQELRKILKSGLPFGPYAEMLLFAAARAELVSEMVLPALEKGLIVVADRFADSTLAYQGYGRGLPLGEISRINALATRGRLPDLTFLLDLPVEETLQRIGPQLALPAEGEGEALKRLNTEGRRFEVENRAFHRRVREGYLRMAKQEPERWVVLAAGRPVQEIAEKVWATVQARLARGEGPGANQEARAGG